MPASHLESWWGGAARAMGNDGAELGRGELRSWATTAGMQRCLCWYAEGRGVSCGGEIFERGS